MLISSSIDDDELTASLSNFVETQKNCVEISEKYILESSANIRHEDLNFRNYISLFTLTYLSDESTVEFCFDTDSSSSLIFASIKKQLFSNASLFFMKDNQRITCQNIVFEKIRSDLWTKLSIRMKTTIEAFVIFFEEYHIMKSISCSIIVRTDLMKSFDINSTWKQQNESNHVIIQDSHRVEMKAISSAKTFEIKQENLTKNLSNLSTKLRFLRSLKRRFTNVYAINSYVLQSDQRKNIEVKHKSLVKRTYQFSSWSHMKAFTSCFVFEISEMINDDVFVISIANFENCSIKIRFDQFLKSLIIEYINGFIEIRLDILRVLLKKVDIDAFKNLDIVS
jgi:hypothetical protein